jgi:hypothetical protein
MIVISLKGQAKAFPTLYIVINQYGDNWAGSAHFFKRQGS